MILTTYSAKDRARVSAYGFKGKHGEPSLGTNVFRKLGMDTDNSGMLSPQDANMRSLEGLDLTSERPLRLT